jgi:DMSO/TMAO reductase YedYZ heme-binding membrane subunit
MMKWNRWVAGVWLASAIAVCVVMVGDNDAYSDQLARTRGLGWHALVALSGALCITPISRWLRESAKLRRALGLAAVSSALLHALLAVTRSPLVLREQLADAHLRFGLGALLVLGLLAITSFPRIVVLLRLHSWKELHRLAYVAWGCVLLHALLSAYAWTRGLFGLTAIVALVSLLRLVPKRERAPSA